MVSKKFYKKGKSLLKNLFHEKSLAISFDRKTYFLKISKRTQIFTFFIFFIAISNIIFTYKENIDDSRKELIFQKNEELTKTNQELDDKVKNIQKQVNLINKYLDVIELENNNFKFEQGTKKGILKINFRKQHISNDNIDYKIQNIYHKIRKRFDETETKIKNLDLFSYQGKNVVYTKYKKSKDNLGVGGPLLLVKNKTINSKSKKEKNISPEEMINRAIENEKFLKLLPFDIPTRANYRISSNFGHRLDPWSNTVSFHNGIDIVSEEDEVISTIDGIVTFSGQMNGYGNLLEIKKIVDDDEICVRFGHVRKIFVQNGDIIKRGQVVALQGNKGRSTAKHIHYEAKYNDVYLNPKNLLVKNI